MSGDHLTREPVMVSPAQAAAYFDQLTLPQKLRAEGRTRKANVYGKTVQFMRLSSTCKIVPVWDSYWHEEYESELEANKAARTWEERVRIMKPGFLSSHS